MQNQVSARKKQRRTDRGFWLWMLPVIAAYGLFKY